MSTGCSSSTADATVTLAALTVTGGNGAGSVGGGIVNFGTLTLTRCTVTGNRAVDACTDNQHPELSKETRFRVPGLERWRGPRRCKKLPRALLTTIQNSQILATWPDVGCGVGKTDGALAFFHTLLLPARAACGGSVGVQQMHPVSRAVLPCNTTGWHYLLNDVANNWIITCYHSREDVRPGAGSELHESKWTGTRWATSGVLKPGG